MDTLDAERIIIETDEENPIAICEITNDGFIVSDGYRVRIKPKQRGENRRKTNVDRYT